MLSSGTEPLTEIAFELVEIIGYYRFDVQIVHLFAYFNTISVIKQVNSSKYVEEIY